MNHQMKHILFEIRIIIVIIKTNESCRDSWLFTKIITTSAKFNLKIYYPTKFTTCCTRVINVETNYIGTGMRVEWKVEIPTLRYFS